MNKICYEYQNIEAGIDKYQSKSRRKIDCDFKESLKYPKFSFKNKTGLSHPEFFFLSSLSYLKIFKTFKLVRVILSIVIVWQPRCKKNSLKLLNESILLQKQPSKILKH